MKKLIALLTCFYAINSFAVNITFNGIASGVNTFSYDADSDSRADAVFTKLGGGNWTFGGPTQSLLINQPGLQAASSVIVP